MVTPQNNFLLKGFKEFVMKRRFRYLILAVMLGATFLSGNYSRSSAERFFPDPACVEQCSFMLQLCFADGGGKNNDHDNACFSVYRHCIAQCGKHD
jgi:hypothetical protein